MRDGKYKRVLPYLSTESWVQSSAIAKKAKLSNGAARNSLRILKNKGKVEQKIIPARNGRGSTGIWRLKP